MTAPLIDPVMHWICSDDTGTSSKTIWETLSGHALYDMHWRSVPLDPSDFGRCHRLLELIPEWRARLPEVAARLPEWGPMVREWGRLTEMYVAAIASGTGYAHALYDRMKVLEDEGAVARDAHRASGRAAR